MLETNDEKNDGYRFSLRDTLAMYASIEEIKLIIFEINDHNQRFPNDRKPVVSPQQARYIHADRMIAARNL
jgi:hypothetical protein